MAIYIRKFSDASICAQTIPKFSHALFHFVLTRHRHAAEWVYISKGTCEFTLMDTENRYVNGVANTGDVWYFPLGWQHSFQAIHPTDGCTTLLWFDDKDGAGSINLSDMLSAYPEDILQASLNGIPSEALLSFPKKQITVAPAEIPGSMLSRPPAPSNLQ